MIENKQVITVPEGKLRDYIDGIFRNDTPEEYVRQNIEKRLVNEHQYPKGLIKIEFPIKVGSANKRVDIAIFPNDCTEFKQENIILIIECKKENISPNDKKDGVGQLKSYMQACGNCEWGMWTNGKDKEVYRKSTTDKGKIEFYDYIDIPSYNTPIEEIDRPSRKKQQKASGDNLLYAFKKCHNHIYAIDGPQKQVAFFELLKIIFCKIEDERNLFEEPEFFVSTKERNNPDGQVTVKKRIEKIFTKVKEKQKQIFEQNDELKLSPRTIAYVVGELQRYSFLDTNIDVKGKAYEEIVGANLRGDRGEFFTPRNVMKMTVEMVAPKIGETVLDSSCGTGGFLVQAMNYVINQIEIQLEKTLGKPKKQWSDVQKQTANDKIKEIASKHFFGFDINPDLVKATKMNMVMNNDGAGNILRANSLLPPHEWDLDFKKTLAERFNIDASKIRSIKDIALFDVIVTNPPFGSKIPIQDPTILSQYEISGTSKSMSPEELFVERCVQFLKPKGRLAVVLPDSILGSPGKTFIREWLLKNCYIIASIDLHQDTFQPSTGTQCSVLIVQKKTEEEKREPFHSYNIFMSLVEKIGHDKRGQDLLKRDKNGEIIYFERTIINENGDIETFDEPELDDQTKEVPNIFSRWKKQEGIQW
ncbi:restriction endonuclease subunit M [Flavobacterium branchiophilum NBRC 15030 = ATCC 35035]|uniref:Type I restriction enzyme M protein n=1 Tax=Flavobacterium branchiophilum TaxID=55197 RepID=A0A543G484_9FLAO|nr:N-6 DNA methylase [Flavobacterium branchiophilum]OXA75364.1 restriction endonuclease subunit M [Flavobacterium branchiophilum NBRC 15030 = ATCC 35035]TQM40912.1 type I restriction enzyme M protein [Flavobacterium branchiophilum]GEM56613.1 restriction endonuclease subunit M [Flavobacterium branchiophilum NBRC 15030 = ATCC 35035]